jgi:hypothetical protein
MKCIIKYKIGKTLFLLLLAGSKSYSQSPIMTIKINDFTYPLANVENIIRWIDLTNSQWENEMKSFQFSDRNIDHGCVYYGSGSSLSEGIYTVDKCPGNSVRVVWFDHSIKGISQFDFLISELESHFITKDDTFAYYGIKNITYAYIFRVARTDGMEAIFVERKLRSENEK